MDKKTAVAICIILALLVAFHHQTNYGIWFEVEDVIHHETLIVALVCLMLGIIFSEKLDDGFFGKKSKA